jgi:hypothetical protein
MLFKKGVLLLALGFAISACASGGHQAASSSGHSYKAAAATATVMGSGVKITKPATMAQVRGPVEVCMTTTGYTVEPAKNGVNAGKGHHHLFIDAYDINVNKPIPKDANHVHMGDGSTCKTLELSAGQHTITAVFAKGNHVPYNPPVKDAIVIIVGDTN